MFCLCCYFIIFYYLRRATVLIFLSTSTWAGVIFANLRPSGFFIVNSDAQTLSKLLNVSLLPLIKLAGLAVCCGVTVVQTHNAFVNDFPKACVDLKLVDVGAEVLELCPHLIEACAELLLAGTHSEALAARPDDHLEVLGVGVVEAGDVTLVDLDGQHRALEGAVEFLGVVNVHCG